MKFNCSLKRIKLFVFLIGFSLFLAIPSSGKSGKQPEVADQSDKTIRQKVQTLLLPLGVILTDPKPIIDVKSVTLAESATCDRVAPAKWTKYLLLGESFEHELKFSEHCDFQGKVKFNQSKIPIDLEVRKLPGVSRIVGSLEVQIDPELTKNLVNISLNLKEGGWMADPESTDKAKPSKGRPEKFASWSLNYQLAVNFLGEVVSNTSGVLTVSQFYKKSVHLKQKFFYPFKK